MLPEALQAFTEKILRPAAICRYPVLGTASAADGYPPAAPAFITERVPLMEAKCSLLRPICHLSQILLPYIAQPVLRIDVMVT